MDMDIKAGSFASPLERWVLRGMAAVFIVCAVVAFRMVDFSNSAAAVNYFLSLGTMMFTILLFIFCINTVAWDKKQKRLLAAIITAYFCCNLPLLLGNGIGHKADLWKSTKRLYTLLYLLSSVYWLTFWLFQKKTYRHYVSEKLIDCVYYSFFAVYCALTIVNHFTGFALDVLPDGQIVIRSRALFHMSIVSIFLYMLIALLTVCSPKTKIVLLSYSLFPLITWFPVFFLPYSQFYTDIFSNVSMFADLAPMYLLFFSVYLDSGHRFLQREKDLQESRANAMVLKISPHFIANTMSSIVALCYPGAPEAGELATKFARYLRDNYADMTDEPMIPFSEELEHIRNYLAVEQYSSVPDRFWQL